MSRHDDLTHGYDEVDFNILWEIVADDLPPLVATIDAYLRDQGRHSP